MTISIIGYGYVGSAVGHLCESNNIEFNVCDKQFKKGNFNYFNNIKKLMDNVSNNEPHFIFVAVPTPSDKEGKCDISIVNNVINQISQLHTTQTYIIIKSTLEPGTCDILYDNYTTDNFYIILNPEFLTEKNYLDDIYNATFVLIGSKNLHMVKYKQILHLYRSMYKHNTLIDIISKSYTECELYKYTLNTFLATKITFFNEIHELSTKMGVDYQQLKTLFKYDNRIGEYGITIPGDDGFGYRKSCLPKEVRGLINLQKRLGLSNELLSCVDKRNTYFINDK